MIKMEKYFGKVFDDIIFFEVKEGFFIYGLSDIVSIK